MPGTTGKPRVEIDTRCQKCGFLVPSCCCGDERLLPDRVADDFSFIKRKLADIEAEKAAALTRPMSPEADQNLDSA